ncbi:MAG: FGGY family carbohydrate kinase, partial [Clostridia bacterium]|nr:FGGY family carbohydrate kinase [Clostridia bacterium]
MKKYILALDQGTTSSRAVLFNASGEIVGIKSRPLTQGYPTPGWVEHDAEEIWNSQMDAVFDCLKATEIQPEEIAAIGITNQRETVVVWDKETGKPIHPAIVWQCRRTSDTCTRLKENGLDGFIKDKTGLIIDAYFSGTKIKWLLDHIPGAREQAMEGKLLAGTMDTWLIWNLTGGQKHVTDYSNASRTMLYNIHTLEWDEELLDLLDIPRAMLPEVLPSSGFFGETYVELFGTRVPICGAAGDQQAALFGQTCFEVGCVKNTYGTGCFILMNTGKTPVVSKHNLLTTIAWDIGTVSYTHLT